jgi:hypothetical protein
VQTIACLDCRELYDVYTRLHRYEPPIGPMPRFKQPPAIPPAVLVEQPTRHFDGSPRPAATLPPLIWEDIKLVCPRSTKHRVEAWRDPGRCPRCGVYLEKNGFPWRLWD